MIAGYKTTWTEVSADTMNPQCYREDKSRMWATSGDRQPKAPEPEKRSWPKKHGVWAK